jgi:hypothetical protein
MVSVGKCLHRIGRFVDRVIEISVSPVVVFGNNDGVAGLCKFVKLEIVDVASFDE